MADTQTTTVNPQLRDYAAESQFAADMGISNPTPDQSNSIMQGVYDPTTLNQIQSNGEWSPQAIQTQSQQANQTYGQAQQDLQQAAPLKDQAANANNGALGVLQSALRKVNDPGNQPIGQSNLFQEAGLGNNNNVLLASLQQRGTEMNQNYQSYANQVGQAGTYLSGEASKYNSYMTGYKTLMDQYNTQVGVLSQIDQSARQHENAMSLAQQQAKLDQQTDQFNEQMKAEYEGTWKTTPLGNGNILKYDGRTGEQQLINGTTGEIISGSGYQGDQTTDYPGTVNADGTTTVNLPDENGDMQSVSIPPGDTVLDGQIMPQSLYDSTLNVGATGIQCGHYTNTMSTAPKVGDSFASKMAVTSVTPSQISDGSYIPKAGDTLAIGMPVSGKVTTGHEVLVTGYDPTTKTFKVTEANRDGKTGTVTKGTYTLDQLNKWKWGLAQGELKSDASKGNTSLLGGAVTALANSPLKDTALGKLVGAGAKAVPKSLMDSLGNLGVNVPGVSELFNAPADVKSIVDNYNNDVATGAVGYQEQLKPYLIPNAKDIVSQGYNSIIQQTSTVDDLVKSRGTAGQAMRTAIEQKVMSIFPDFSWDNLKQNVTTTKNYEAIQTKANTGLQQNEGRLTAELQNLQTLSSQYNRGSGALSVAWNQTQNTFEYQSSDPKYVKFAEALNTTADSYANIMKSAGGSGSVSDAFLHQALDMLNPNLSQGGLSAQIGQINNEMKNRMTGLLSSDLKSNLLPVSAQLPIGQEQTQTAAQQQGAPQQQPQQSGQIGVQAPDGQTYYFASQAQATQFQQSLQSNQ